MTKAKFMLLGIGVIGAVSGALAFKAQKFTGIKYCTAKTSSTCPVTAHWDTALPVLGSQLHCTATSGVTCTQTITVAMKD